MFKPKVSIFVKVKDLFRYGKTTTCKPNLQHATCTLHLLPAINFFSGITELMASFEKSYTPSAKTVEIDHAFPVKEWMTQVSTTLHNISNPHAFKFTKGTIWESCYAMQEFG